MRRIKHAIALCALASAASAGAAYAGGASTTVATKHTSLGTILVTSTGQTLYADAGDKPPQFACTGGCLTAWPPLKARGALKAKGGAKAAKLGKTKGPGGEMVTYNGHPLYTFAGGAGTSGQGQDGFYVVSVKGAIVKNTTQGSGSW